MIQRSSVRRSSGKMVCAHRGILAWDRRVPTGVIVQPSAREMFTPRELTDAYKKFMKHGPRYLDAESGIEGSVYRFGTRVLIVYEEPKSGVVVLIHPTSYKGYSPNFAGSAF